jgi:hypothetical protein
MKQMRTIIFSGVCALLALGVRPCSAVIIQGELYDSFALVNNDGVTVLAGDATAGDLVQVIETGPDDAINVPGSGTGAPSGDDTVLFTLHVGTGIPSSGTGLLDAYPLDYDSSLVNTDIYVRFWNGTTVADSTYYGNSSIFQLPAGDAFNQSQLDFVPLSGSPHTTDQPFSLSTVPEPSSLFLFGLGIFGVWTWKRRRWVGTVAAAVAIFAVAQNAPAQLALPLDVTASAPVLDANGAVLPGNNPASADYGLTAIPGVLVQIIGVGSNGVAHLPNLDGSPSGGDTVLYTTVIGQGMDLGNDNSGRFATSFSPPPSSGMRVYARVFNAPTMQNATAWGQSATIATADAVVIDLSLLGLKAATMPMGIDLNSIDSKGVSYFQELIANTDPLNPRDLFAVSSLLLASGQGNVAVQGHTGRSYTLQRSTDAFGDSMTWSDIVATGLLSTDQNLILNDPNPPSTTRAFYRVKVSMP